MFVSSFLLFFVWLLLFFIIIIFSIYLDVQPQDTQAPIGSIREFANMFSLTMGWWNISIRMAINNRALSI